MGKTKILIYDSISDGHHLDYLFYLIHQATLRPNLEIIILSHQNILQTLTDFNFPIHKYPQITFQFLSETQIQKFHSHNILKRSLLEWNYAINIAKENQANEIIFPYFDYFQFGALFGNKPSAKISGIIFSSIAQNPLYARLKKYIINTLANKSFIKNITILSEEYFKSLTTISNKIQYLHDPIYTFPNNPTLKKSFFQNLNIPKNKTSFLNFGHLDNRKGIIPFLEACILLNPNQREKIHLILAGKLDPKIKPAVENLLNQLPEISTSLHFDYIKPEEIQYLFESTHWSLVLYPNFLGSSSILIRSAFAKKPILGNAYGNIAYLIEKHQIGLTANPNNPQDIAQKLSIILTENPTFKPQSFDQFSQNHTLENFGNTLLGPITQNT